MRIFDLKFCHRCQYERTFSKRAVNHRFHLFVTLATLGLWGIGWAAASIVARSKHWRCGFCGSRHAPGTEMPAVEIR